MPIAMGVGVDGLGVFLRAGWVGWDLTLDKIWARCSLYSRVRCVLDARTVDADHPRRPGRP